MAGENARLTYDGREYDLPIITGTEGEKALDVSSLRRDSGMITLDQGYGNTAPCKSAVTYVDGERGVLCHRGYPIEQLVEKSSFIETAMLLIFGDLPTLDELKSFREMLTEQELLNENLLHHFDGFPPNGQPMAIISAVVNSLGSFHPDLLDINTEDEFRLAVAKILSKIRTIAAFAHCKSIGRPRMYPNPQLHFCRNFLHMMFSIPNRLYEAPDSVVSALSKFLIVHADHEQTPSSSTARMVGSTQANLFASVASGICALWGPLHGGASARILLDLENIRTGKATVASLLEDVKSGRFKLMGFGHRIYKTRDPRSDIMRKAAMDLSLDCCPDCKDLVDIAVELEETALADDYFLSRNLYPNLDFYSGIILKAIDIPLNMFPVMIAVGSTAGWIAQWYEQHRESSSRIHRPRQIYMGETMREYVPIDDR